jgi:hypothetical protein
MSDTYIHEKSTERCSVSCVDIPNNVSDHDKLEIDNDDTDLPPLLNRGDDIVNSVVILDWDDTCLPSHALHTSPSKIHPLHQPKDEWYTETWNKLENKLYDTLSDLKSKYPIYIVTDAEDQWVELTCEKFYPKIWNILDEFEIYSANSLYKKEYPDSAFKRKSATIEKISETFEKNEAFFWHLPYQNQFLSVGDAPHDREAIQNVAKIKQWIFKNIKFAVAPSVKTLAIQWDLLHYTLPCILWTKGNMDLNMTLTKV